MHGERQGDSPSCLSCGRSVDVHLTAERSLLCNREAEGQKLNNEIWPEVYQ